MKQAVIDIGSNSIRLTLYAVEGRNFNILFREKIMAGLAGYVEQGALSGEGVARAKSALLEFKRTLELLDIHRVAVIATASLRNVTNTDQAVRELQQATGFPVTVLSGQQEARLGYAGAMEELHLKSGVFVDVGGASTEVVAFQGGQVVDSASFAVGSLSLYRTCVKKILPGPGSLERIRHTLRREMDEKGLDPKEKRSPLVGVGGTARAVLKLARQRFDLDGDCRTVTRAQLEELAHLLTHGEEREAAGLILKTAPDRIHTLVPGLMVLVHIIKAFDADELVVSRYGVREGYLCQMLQTPAAPTRRTGN